MILTVCFSQASSQPLQRSRPPPPSPSYRNNPESAGLELYRTDPEGDESEGPPGASARLSSMRASLVARGGSWAQQASGRRPAGDGFVCQPPLIPRL